MSVVMPRFLDVEASSLNKESYPIEIAWSDALGNIQSSLINPYSVDVWVDWDFYAQHKIHGISRQMCREQGIHPKDMCRLMSDSVRPGEIIYADGGEFDENWVDVLFGAGTTRGFAQFRVVHSDEVMLPFLMKIEPDDSKKRDLIYSELKDKARKIVKTQHRAVVDVQYLIELWKLCVCIEKMMF